MKNMDENRPLMTRIVEKFLRGDVAIMLVAVSLVVGAASLWLTPREEEPQIVVPLADVLVGAPGLSAEEVEQKVTRRLEKLLFQIDGVEYVSGQKLNFPAGTGLCFLEAPDGKTYWCDDSIIIAALTRFWLTYFIKLDDKWPEPRFELPLLSRKDSRKYLQWHQIPHPGEW